MRILSTPDLIPELEDLIILSPTVIASVHFGLRDDVVLSGPFKLDLLSNGIVTLYKGWMLENIPETDGAYSGNIADTLNLINLLAQSKLSVVHKTDVCETAAPPSELWVQSYRGPNGSSNQQPLLRRILTGEGCWLWTEVLPSNKELSNRAKALIEELKSIGRDLWNQHQLPSDI